MFNFFKKKNEEEVTRISRENVDCICTLNKYLDQHCNLEFKNEYILVGYQNGEMKIYYDQIKDCGKIINSKYGIQDAIDKNILSQSVFQSPGFLAGNFYTLTNKAKIFLYLKFVPENSGVQTLLVEYDKGVEKALSLIEKNQK